MAQYSRTVLTDAGVILARRIMDDETLTMEFTRIQTGSGEYSSGEDIASRTSLKAPKQSFPISSRSVTSEQVLHLKYVVSNVNPDLSPLTVGYYVRELAIYAQVSGEAEILYAIAIADADSADYLPEYDELQPTTITMDWFLPVGNAEQINVYASPDAYALAEDLEALALVVDDKLDADGDSAGNTVTFTSSDVPDSSVTKDTGWTTSGALSSGETHESFMTKISRMIKNIRWIYKLIGTTDISSIGNGTITGGLSSLNDSLESAVYTGLIGESLSIAGGVLYARRIGRIVNYIWLGNANNVDDDTPVGTLAVAFRPTADTYFVIRNNLTSYKGSYIAITSGGIVTAYGGGGARGRGSCCTIAFTEHV